ncbi:Triosephosphate isomerase-domain-containing protein [Polychytrium aggregatum]|uniref:Triosephosphate isomerase-domain-containing protein n=1 Tax=Polychytrium aggregatum TaxID=110093 RepID=UPI0022FF2069|nr:Triosephosphate isomerase-domain-containing protein [Polychytrium aggregatum]KAI9202075.1 Triosephosphate isomerase-domain-containing protein [Polychytrium aggregatum]
MARKFLIGGNWKMNGSVEQCMALAAELNSNEWNADRLEIVVAPPSIYFRTMRQALKKDAALMAQNVHFEKSGAFTGEVSTEFLKDLGVAWAMTGHSERREIFQDSNEIVGRKTARALANGVNVIVCCGEKLEHRESNRTNEAIFGQLQAVADQIEDPKDWANLVIAYEPVWAIGTGKVATPEQAQATHVDIRNWIRKRVSDAAGDAIRILYTGSVNASNCAAFVDMPDIDGFVLGRASLDPKEFAKVIALSASCANHLNDMPPQMKRPSPLSIEVPSSSSSPSLSPATPSLKPPKSVSSMALNLHTADASATPLSAPATAWRTFFEDTEAVDRMPIDELRTKMKQLLSEQREKDRGKCQSFHAFLSCDRTVFAPCSMFDLSIAGELGQQLVEANNTLAIQYEDLLQKYEFVLRETQNAKEDAEIVQKSFANAELKALEDADTQEKLSALDAQVTALTQSLEIAYQNNRKIEQVHNRSISSLQKTNSELQDQLKSALRDLREAEHTHTKAVAGLERDLDQLRTELHATAETAQQLEAERKRLLNLMNSSIKEKSNSDKSDAEQIKQLSSVIVNLESENAQLTRTKADATNKLNVLREELNSVQVKYDEAEEIVSQYKYLKDEYDQQKVLIEELKASVEEQRQSYQGMIDDLALVGQLPNSAIALRGGIDHNALVLTDDFNGDWQWVKWIERTRVKAWERDIRGLREEIDNLRENRQHAVLRLRQQVENLVVTVAAQLPAPVQALTKTVLGVSGVAGENSGLALPSPGLMPSYSPLWSGSPTKLTPR